MLPEHEKRALIAFLVSQRQTRKERERLARKIDDKVPSHWVTLEELEKRFADDVE